MPAQGQMELQDRYDAILTAVRRYDKSAQVHEIWAQFSSEQKLGFANTLGADGDYNPTASRHIAELMATVAPDSAIYKILEGKRNQIEEWLALE